MATADEVSQRDKLYDHPGASRSKVWRHFGFKRYENIVPPKLDMTRTFCRKCGRSHKYNDHEHKGWIADAEKGSTGSQKQPKITQFQADNTTSVYHRPLTSAKKKRIDSALTNMMVDRLLPFSFVDSDSFKTFAQELDDRYDVPGRKLVLKQIDKKYIELQDKLLIELKGAKVAITHDAWSSINTQSYDTVTVHYISNAWELKSAVLETGHFPGSHTSENIAKHLQTTLDKWGIVQPICVTDNASNERKAIELMNLTRVGCYGHKINLIVKNSLATPEVNKLLAKGRAVVTFFHQSPLATNVLIEKQKQLLNSEVQNHKLIQDVSTRWNSTPDMLERLCEQTPAVHATVLDESLSKKAQGLRHKVFSLDETVFANRLVELLQPFKIATVKLSAENVPTHHLVLPIMKKLEKALEITQDDCSDGLKTVKREMTKQLQNRFSADQDVALLAALLCPSTKHLLFLSDDEREKAKQLLYQQVNLVKAVKIKTETNDDQGEVRTDQEPALPTLGEHMVEVTVNEMDIDSSIADIKPPCKVAKLGDHNNWLDDIIFCGQESSNRLSDDIIARQEVDRYMAENLVGFDSNINPLEWWKENAVYYPRVSKVAKQYLAVPASSVPSERVFSLAGSLISKKRSQLKPEHVNKMIFLKQEAQGPKRSPDLSQIDQNCIVFTSKGS